MKRIIALLLLFFMIISFVAPFLGACNKNEEIPTDYQMYAGVTQILYSNYENTYSNVTLSNGLSITDINKTMLSALNYNIYTDDEKKECIEVECDETDTDISNVSEQEYMYEEYDMPHSNGFKSFMPYTTITDKTSQQYKLQQQYSYTGDYGIREADNRYCIAVGTAFNTAIGTYADLILENGTILECIIGEIKDDKDTDYTNIITKDNGCVSEFIVDMSILDSNVINAGDMSTINETWNSKVTKLKVYNKNIFTNQGEIYYEHKN